MRESHGERAKRSAGHRLIEITGVTLFMGLTAAILARLWVTAGLLDAFTATWVLALGVLCSYLMSDFTSGFVHWAADNYGTRQWPILGPNFIGPFRDHHVDPEELSRHDFLELNGNNCTITMFVMWIPFVQGFGAWPLFVSTFWLGVAWWTFGTNQFHAWAHAPNPPKIAVVLQKLHVILRPVHHNVHHVPPHAGNYCITNGWMNAPLRWLRFFPILEWMLEHTLDAHALHRTGGESEVALVRHTAGHG